MQSVKSLVNQYELPKSNNTISSPADVPELKTGNVKSRVGSFEHSPASNEDIESRRTIRRYRSALGRDTAGLERTPCAPSCSTPEPQRSAIPINRHLTLFPSNNLPNQSTPGVTLKLSKTPIQHTDSSTSVVNLVNQNNQDPSTDGPSPSIASIESFDSTENEFDHKAKSPAPSHCKENLFPISSTSLLEEVVQSMPSKTFEPDSAVSGLSVESSKQEAGDGDVEGVSCSSKEETNAESETKTSENSSDVFTPGESPARRTRGPTQRYKSHNYRKDEVPPDGASSSTSPKRFQPAPAVAPAFGGEKREQIRRSVSKFYYEQQSESARRGDEASERTDAREQPGSTSSGRVGSPQADCTTSDDDRLSPTAAAAGQHFLGRPLRSMQRTADALRRHRAPDTRQRMSALVRSQDRQRVAEHVFIVRLDRTALHPRHTVNPEVDVVFVRPADSDKAEIIRNCCFPNVSFYSYEDDQGIDSEMFRLILTNQEGEQTFAYCRYCIIDNVPRGRDTPQNGAVKKWTTQSRQRLVDALVILSKINAHMFFEKILSQLVEQRHQSFEHARRCLEALFEVEHMPPPGQARVLSGCHGFLLERPLSLSEESPNFYSVLCTFSSQALLRIFAHIICEGSIVVMASRLSNVTRFIDFLTSVLIRPLSWPHTLIPVLPSNMMTVVEAPCPFIVGIHLSQRDQLSTDISSTVMLAHVDSGETYVNPVPTLPKRFTKWMGRALHFALDDSHFSPEEVDYMVKEVFLKFFVTTLGSYRRHLVAKADGLLELNETNFVRSHPKSVRRLVESLVETNLFELFIAERLRLISDVARMISMRPADAVRIQPDKLTEHLTMRDMFEQRVAQHQVEQVTMWSKFKQNIFRKLKSSGVAQNHNGRPMSMAFPLAANVST